MNLLIRKSMKTKSTTQNANHPLLSAPEVMPTEMELLRPSRLQNTFTCSHEGLKTTMGINRSHTVQSTKRIEGVKKPG